MKRPRESLHDGEQGRRLDRDGEHGMGRRIDRDRPAGGAWMGGPPPPSPPHHNPHHHGMDSMASGRAYGRADSRYDDPTGPSGGDAWDDSWAILPPTGGGEQNEIQWTIFWCHDAGSRAATVRSRARRVAAASQRPLRCRRCFRRHSSHRSAGAAIDGRTHNPTTPPAPATMLRE